MARSVLTPQAEDFPRWYQDVIAKAQLAENGPARGTMIIRPWAFAMWEHIQSELDDRIKATGHENAYFPLFIPMSFLTREAEHVEGFSPELAVVTHGGGSELGESLAVRPTSETVIGDAMARWVQSHRDLPLLLNQWANVVRWELRPRLFLRTSEFLWQEGHTAHATWQDAQDETLRMHAVYDDLLRNVLSIAPVLGRKTERERFAGAEATYTLEGLMRDGKALQLGTSHNLGQNFARAFDIGFSDSDGKRQLCWTTSWGMTTRTIGAMIMVHGDDAGLRLPPKVAPAEVVVLAVREEAADACRDLFEALAARGVRARLDADTHTGFGRRATEWELKGVPLRVEIGPRDLESGVATVVRRDADDGRKTQVALADAADTVAALLPQVQADLLAQSDAFRRANTHDATSVDDVIATTADGRPGFHRVPWSVVGADGEDRLAEHALTVRCLTTADDGVPAPDTADDDLVAWIAKSY